uniref:Putative ribonuclease H-like domain-containing protein n=1 Tax=Tanacetum cinerariifolium TaxID=118510 RepID=A0A699GJ71_TANCI|nr:putative ribonuclease H-like domain-containing protein [Tanacetum cinerariifolium]
MNYDLIIVGTQSNGFVGTKVSDNACQAKKEIEPVKDYILLPLWTTDPPISQHPKSSHNYGFKPSCDDGKKVDEDPSKENECNDQEKEDNINSTNNVNTVSATINADGTNEDNELSFDPNMPALEDFSTFNFSSDDEDDSEMADMKNLDTTIQVSPILTRIHKDHPLDQVIGDLQSAIQTRKMSKNLKEHGFVSTIQQRTNHKDLQNCLFACFYHKKNPKRIKAIRLFLAYASFKDFVVYQMDVKSAFLYGKIKEEVYVCQLPEFEDPDFLDQVYKVKKALYGLHQALRAWFTEVKTASTPMETQKPLLKDEDGEEVDVYIYRYQVNQKVLHIHAVKRIFKYLKGQPKLGLWYLKDSPFDLVVYTDSDYARASLDRKSTTGGCQFLGYGKKIIMTESSVRRDLRLVDEEGIDCLLNSTVFEQLALMWKPKRKNTKVPQPSRSTKNVADEAVHKELGDILLRTATTASSLKVKQDSGNIDKTQSKATPNKSSSQRTDSGGDPRYEKAMEDTTTQTRFESVFKHFDDLLLTREKTKTTQSNEIVSLNRRVKKPEKRNRLRTHKLKRLYKVGLIARLESLNEESLGEDASKHERIEAIDQDEDITLVNVQDDVEMFDVNDLGGKETLKPKVKGIVIQEHKEQGKSTTTKATISKQQSQDKGKGIMVEEPVKLKKKDQIELDEEAAKRLQAEFDEEERLARERPQKEREGNIALIETWDDVQAKLMLIINWLKECKQKNKKTKRAEEKRNKPPTQAQQRKIMCTYLKNMKGYKLNDLKTELVKGKEKREGGELIQESTKKQKVEDDKETAELKQLTKIIPDKEEVEINVITLAVRSPGIVDWKIYKEGKKSYYQIMRIDRKSQMYMVFSKMLESFYIEDLVDLYKLGKAKFKSTRPVEDLDLLL